MTKAPRGQNSQLANVRPLKPNPAAVQSRQSPLGGSQFAHLLNGHYPLGPPTLRADVTQSLQDETRGMGQGRATVAAPQVSTCKGILEDKAQERALASTTHCSDLGPRDTL